MWIPPYSFIFVNHTNNTVLVHFCKSCNSCHVHIFISNMYITNMHILASVLIYHSCESCHAHIFVSNMYIITSVHIYRSCKSYHDWLFHVNHVNHNMSIYYDQYHVALSCSYSIAYNTVIFFQYHVTLFTQYHVTLSCSFSIMYHCYVHSVSYTTVMFI